MSKWQHAFRVVVLKCVVVNPGVVVETPAIFVVVEYGADELVVYGFVVELVCGMDVVELNIIVVVILLAVVEA